MSKLIDQIKKCSENSGGDSSQEYYDVNLEFVCRYCGYDDIVVFGLSKDETKVVSIHTNDGGEIRSFDPEKITFFSLTKLVD